MRLGHAILTVLLLGIASTLGMFVLSLRSSRVQRRPEEGATTSKIEGESVEGRASLGDLSTWPSSVPKLNLASLPTSTEVVSKTPGASVHGEMSFTLEEFSNRFVEDVKASGDASDAVAQRGAKILATWDEKGPAELRALAHFSGPECYAKGCVITGTVNDPERLHEITSEFVRDIGLSNLGGMIAVWQPSGSDSDPADQMAFVVYSESDRVPQAL